MEGFRPISLNPTLVLEAQTLELTSVPKVKRIDYQSPVEGGDAVHAFYDTNMIYVATRSTLTEIFDLIETQIVTRLKNFPFSLAGLYDFVGKPDTAKLLRINRSTAFILPATSTDTPTASGGPIVSNIHTDDFREEFRPSTTSGDFVKGVLDFAALTRDNQARYNGRNAPSLHA